MSTFSQQKLNLRNGVLLLGALVTVKGVPSLDYIMRFARVLQLILQFGDQQFADCKKKEIVSCLLSLNKNAVISLPSQSDAYFTPYTSSSTLVLGDCECATGEMISREAQTTAQMSGNLCRENIFLACTNDTKLLNTVLI